MSLVSKGRLLGRYSLGTTICLVAVLLYTLTFFVLQVRLYKGLHMQIYDLGYFDQALYNSLHGHFLETSVRFPEGKSLFAEHIYLILLFILPIYALFPHPYTLFFLQAFGAGIGAWAIFLIAKHRLHDEFAATCFGLAYLLHPSLQGSTLNAYEMGFHPENFFPPLLLFAYYFLSIERLRLSGLFFVLALTPVELDAIPLAALGVYLLVKDRQHKKIGRGLVGLSLLWLLVAVALTIFHFRGGSLPWYFERVSTGPGNVEGEQIWLTWLKLGPTFLRYLFLLLAPVVFLPVADLSLLATSLPNLFLNLFATAEGYIYPLKTDSWHVAPILPIMFLASISGLATILRRVRDKTLATRLRRACPTTVLLAAALCTYLFGPLPFARSVQPDRYAVNEVAVRGIAEVKALIPQEASLAAERHMGSNFTQRRTLIALRGPFWTYWKGADCVLLNFNARFGYISGESRRLLPILKKSPCYELIYAENNIRLFRHRPPPMEHPLSANLGHMVQLLGYDLSSDRLKPGDILQLTLYWQALNKMETNYTVFTHLVDEDNNIRGQKDNWPMDNTYPTTKWVRGEIVIDSYDIIVDKQAPPGQYTVEIGMYDLATDERLPVLNAHGRVKDNAPILGYVWVEDP